MKNIGSRRPHFEMVNACNLLLGNNTKEEIMQSKYPYIKAKPSGMNILEYVDMLIAYFAELDQFDWCKQLDACKSSYANYLDTHCQCAFPMFEKVYKVREPKCTCCNKSIPMLIYSE